MAKSQSATFHADADRIWGAVVKLVSAAGYAVSETNVAAKQIKYEASGGGWAWAQRVTISVTGVGDNETMVTVKAAVAGQATLTEGGQQSKLIKFVIDKLAESFPLSENQATPIMDAPGTSGCLGMVLVLMCTGLSLCVTLAALLVR